MRSIWLLLCLTLLSPPVYAKPVKYNFDIDYRQVNITGKPVRAMTINRQLPGPTIEAEVGDQLEVTFNNKMDVETSVHWHGVLLPNDQDGVPYLTTLPIKAGQSFTYSFPITHAGTYWYHSHTNLQEQRGIYGPLVFKDNKEKSTSRPSFEKEYVVVISDWTNENPKRVLAHIKKDGDYYALKKDSVQSWNKVIKHNAVKNRIKQAWSRMEPMDLGDVGYDAFLTNGNIKSYLPKLPAKKPVLLRVINASASTYFNLQFSAGPMQIIASDGMDIQPFYTNKLFMAIAETYDIIIQIPDDKAYELRATAQDVSGYTSLIVGHGDLVPAPTIKKPNLVKMTMHHGHHKNMHDSVFKKKIGYTKNYENLRAVNKSNLPANPWRTFRLNLEGNMERYIWTFNKKTLTEADRLLIKKGENVRFILTNKTMMNHPFHLHGHFFRVVNSQRDYSPLKHTVNIAPMETVRIEFLADKNKDWIFHCHNLYHMKAGMARVIHYENSEVSEELKQARTENTLSKDDDWFFSTKIDLQTNHSKVWWRPSNNRNAFEFKAENDYASDSLYEALYLRNLSRFLDLYAGTELEKRAEEKSKLTGKVGLRYTLPLLIEADIHYNSDNEFVISLSSELQLTKRLNFEWSYNSDNEYEFDLHYELNKSILLAANVSSDYGYGFGVKLKF